MSDVRMTFRQQHFATLVCQKSLQTDGYGPLKATEVPPPEGRSYKACEFGGRSSKVTQVDGGVLMRRVVLAGCLFALAIPVSAQVTGRAIVQSSDRLSVNGRAFELFGVDGFEFHQTCFVDGRVLACGASATRALQTLLDPVAVTCTPVGDRVGEVQKATCTTAEGDVAENMVRQGWAIADRVQSDRYIAAEDAARAAKSGVWRGVFAEPRAYRADITAIEVAYIGRSLDPLVGAIEAALTENRGGIGVFAEVSIAIGEGTTAVREIRAGMLATGFIDAAIPERDVFNWATVAAAAAAWRADVLATVAFAAADDVWTELSARPGPTLVATDAPTFYDALREAAAPLLATGRRPVLIVPAPDNPVWVREWFAGTPPGGAQLAARDDAWPGYLGTIDGIDVYVGPWAPNDQALLFPDDILTGITLRRQPDGGLVTADAVTEAGTLIFRFERAITWTADEVIRIEYPHDDAVPYNGS
jgi:endonuclease YncB( thermonuclease family)